MDGTVLIADDDKTIRTVLSQALTRAGCKVKATASLITLIRWIGEGLGNIVISDIMMPDGNGLDILPEIQKMRPDLPVIIISAQNTLTTAIKVEENRPFDYLPKPFDLPELLHKVSLGLKIKESKSKSKLPELHENLPLVGSSNVMLDLYRLLAKIMNLDDPVFIIGESGTGKTLIANTIHNFSDRRTLNIIHANQNDFLDHETGLALLHKAKRGTILIEEISSLDINKQNILTGLLDFELENKPRFVITSRSISVFNELDKSLLFRISKFIINASPLRFRLNDIESLIKHYFSNEENQFEDKLLFQKEALRRLKDYYWPGNIRQLENVLQTLSMSKHNPISSSHVEDILMAQPVFHDGNEHQDKISNSIEYHLNRYFERHGEILPPEGLYDRIIHEVEVPLIKITLNACGGNQLKCAKILGLNRNTLRKKLKLSDINVTKYKKMMY